MANIAHQSSTMECILTRRGAVPRTRNRFLPFRGGNGGGPNPMPYLPAKGRNDGPVYLLITGKLRDDNRHLSK